jgi:acylglycerol lipase
MAVSDYWEAWPATPESLFAGEAIADQMGTLGKVTTFTNAQGLQLACYFWPATTAQPKAVVQLCHGNGAYAMEFLRTQGAGKPLIYKGSWIERLNRAGVSVAGFDMQGCGFSEGLRGLRSFFESFEDVIADAVQFRRLIPECGLPGFSSVPIFLTGISLGGCVAIHVMQRHAELYKGVLLLAPMVSLEKVSRAGLNPYLLPLSRLVSWLVPAAQVAKVNRNPLYPELQQEWDEDPLNFQGNTRARSAAACRVCQGHAGAAPPPQRPQISLDLFPWRR